MFIRNLRPFLRPAVLATWLLAIVPVVASEDVEQAFQTPPPAARPWVYWVWLETDIPRATITRDLEEMKAKGIAGCILYGNQSGGWKWNGDVVLSNKDYHVVKNDAYKNSYMTPLPPGPPLVSWSPHWRDLVRFSASESARLGLDLVVCDGLAGTSGAIPEQYGEQQLALAETVVSGPRVFDKTLVEPKTVAMKGRPTRPRPGFYHRDVAVLAVPDHDGFSASEVINLSTKMDATGHLHWEVPAGDWRIIRFVQVPTGKQNAWGYFNDSMSARAMDEQWKVTMAPLLKDLTAEERRGLEGIEDDSWEAGKTTWTELFPEEFKKRRGYDLIAYLPVIAGIKMSDAATRARILRDYALTISDLIVDNHYGELNRLAEKNGLVFHSEAAGPNYDWADMLKTSSRVDDAMAEFWMPSEHRPTMNSRFLLRNAANANHIYGKKITMCEAFTSLGPEWEETPFTMKSVADQAFCDGLNKICVHNFGQSPSMTAKPGYVYCAGTQYNPGISWWDETPAFNLYLARCSSMLQAGKFVADAIFYHGDNISHGEQRKTLLPALGEGYDHDNCNSEVLLTRMSVRAGRIVLPDGMSYRVLVLPEQQPMPLADLEKLAALAEAGATIVGPPPTGMAGLPLNPGDSEQFKTLVAQLWSGLDGDSVTQKPLGAGLLVWGPTVRQVLQDLDVPPDFMVSGVSPDGTIDWIHRQTEDTDFYYVASRWTHPENVVCTFRISGKQPELWNPVTGEMRDATAFQQANGGTTIPLDFDPNGSVFVVFKKSIPTILAGTTTSNYPVTRLLTTLSGPWTVNFDPKWGGPSQTVFNQLMDWTNSADPGIKYYSGTAVYHQHFDLSAESAKSRLMLDLGEVHEIASVRLNGKNLGVVWTKPAHVDLSDAAKTGDNDLEITIVNLWPNRLNRDESLPKEQRLTETNIHKFVPGTPLLPSGLIGPVNVLAVAPPPPVPN